METANTPADNATEVDNVHIQKEHADILVRGEEVRAVFVVTRDVMIFTDRRLILVDRLSSSGRRMKYLTLPYKSIRYFSLETAVTPGGNAELKIWLAGGQIPTIQKQLTKDVNVVALQKVLASFVLR